MPIDHQSDLDLIDRVVDRFCAHYQERDREETRSAANLHYVVAIQKWDPESASVSREVAVASTIWHRLLDTLRTRARRDARHPRVSTEVLDDLAIAERRTVGDLMESASADARTICDLALDPPEQVAAAASRWGGQPRNYRRAIREYLAAIGWGRARVRETIREMGQLLRG
jgi:hypothetical protein